MALLEGHSTVLYGDELYIFGGKDNKTGQLLNTVWKISAPAAQVAASQFTTANKLDENTNNNDSFLSSPTKKMGSARELATMGSGAVASVVSTTGQLPTPRCYHCVALRPPFMLVWGGTTLHPAQVVNPRGERVTEDRCSETVMFALHLETREWAVHVLGGRETRCPKSRCHATMSATAHSILMYGGYPNVADDETGTPLVEANHWSVFEVGADATVRSNARAGSEVPMLWGHTSLFAHGCLCVFGGVDFATMTETNALCLFSLEEKRWRWAEFALAPEARALHTAVLHGSNMYVYGGFTGRPDRTDHPAYNDVWRFSLNTGLWDECACGGAVPPARSGHTATVVQNSMFVVGGLEGNKETLPDHCTLAILDLHSFSWTLCPITFPMNLGLSRGGAGDGGLSHGNAAVGDNNNSPISYDAANNESTSALFGRNNNTSDDNGMMMTPRKSNISLTAAGGGGGSTSPNQHNNQNNQNNNNNNNTLSSSVSNRFGTAGTILGGANTRRGTSPSSSGNNALQKGNNNNTRLMSQQERDVLEAASTAGLAGAFGNLSAGGGAGNPNINKSQQLAAIMSNINNNKSRQQQQERGVGGIPSASGNPNVAPSLASSRSSSMFVGGANNNSNNINNNNPNDYYSSGNINNNNNQNNTNTNNNRFSVPNFAEQIQQQQQRTNSPPNNNYNRNNNYNINTGGDSFMSTLQSMMPTTNRDRNQQQQQNNTNPSSILGGLTSSSPIRDSNDSTYNNNDAGDNFNNNNNKSGNYYNENNNNDNNEMRNMRNLNNYMRSPSNALLSNVNKFDHQNHNQVQSEKERTQQAVQEMQHEAQQGVSNLQSQYSREGVPVVVNNNNNNNNNDDSRDRGSMSWMDANEQQNDNPPSHNRGNMYHPNQNSSQQQQNNAHQQERSQARAAGEGRQGSPAMTNVWNTDPDQLPGRRPYGSAIEFSTGSFQPPGHSLREKASQLAQEQLIQKHIDDTSRLSPPTTSDEQQQQQNFQHHQGGFGVRPSGGLGRSNSVGLGMPPSMIDSMNNNNYRNQNQNQQRSPSRRSPSRSSSSTSFGRRSMMRMNML